MLSLGYRSKKVNLLMFCRRGACVGLKGCCGNEFEELGGRKGVVLRILKRRIKRGLSSGVLGLAAMRDTNTQTTYRAPNPTSFNI